MLKQNTVTKKTNKIKAHNKNCFLNSNFCLLIDCDSTVVIIKN